MQQNLLTSSDDCAHVWRKWRKAVSSSWLIWLNRIVWHDLFCEKNWKSSEDSLSQGVYAIRVVSISLSEWLRVWFVSLYLSSVTVWCTIQRKVWGGGGGGGASKLSMRLTFVILPLPWVTSQCNQQCFAAVASPDIGTTASVGVFSLVQGPVSWRSSTVKWRYSFHSPTVIPPTALDKPSIRKRYHRRRRRTCSHTSPRRSPTMVTLPDTRFVECRWWNDGWTVKTVVTWRSSASMIPAPGILFVSLS